MLPKCAGCAHFCSVAVARSPNRHNNNNDSNKEATRQLDRQAAGHNLAKKEVAAEI